MKTILEEEIRRYIRGQLSPSDKALFEARMKTDPFLADAVAGYSIFPESLPSNAVLKANLAVVMSLTVVGLMWMGLWWLEKSLFIEMSPEPIVSIEKTEKPKNSFVAISPMQKKDITPIAIENGEKLPAVQKSIPIALKAIPLGAREAVESEPAHSRRPRYRYKATFIHDLKVVSVDTSAHIEQNVLPEHLPARWESESQLLGSKEIYTPKMSKRHYMDYPLELFQKGRYEACLVQINKILKRLPGNLNLSFYRALCHYHLEEYDSAIEQFRATQRIVQPGFYEEAKWYEALCLEKAGQANQAKEIYTEIVNQNGFYAIRAASRLAMLLQAE